MRRLLLLLVYLTVPSLYAQVQSFPYVENFDTVTVPALPKGWSTSINRLATGDFATTTSSPRSSPNAVISTNSTVFQYLVSPRLDFTNRVPDKLQYWTSRSSTHTSGVLVEASTDNGGTYPITVSDTLKNPGTTSYNSISLNIPASLSNQNQVRFRWRVIGGTGGTSGTFRIDDVTLTVKTSIDLAVRSVSVSPLFPLVTDTVTISVVLANLGVLTPASYTVELFDDVNRDSVGQAGERFRQLPQGPISPGDSLTVQTQWSGFTSGDHQILVVVSTSGDENPTNNRAISSFNAGLTPRTVVLNEIMYAPASPEPEWIELFNTSADSISLRNWKITDNTGVKVTITTKDIYLRSKDFIVLAADSAFFNIHPTVPCRVVVMNLPALNNTGDAVVLFDSRSLTMDSLTFTPSWGGSGGHSLERISVGGLSSDQANWGTSLDPSGSSPGRVNTLSQKSNDLALSTISVSPQFPNAGGSLVLTARVKNVGTNVAPDYVVSFFEDANGDSIEQSSELITRITSTGSLQPRDSASFSVQVLNVSLGDHRYIARVEYPSDEEPLNNKQIVLVTVGLPPKTVVINEIMYGPGGGESEWIEIYNTSSTEVNLKNWKLSNRITSTKYTITTSDATLPPEGFAVVTRDSLAFQTFHPSILGLLFVNGSLPIALFSNSGDAVVVFDSRNAPMDSLFYSPSWGGSGGKSLERIAPLGSSTDQSNWGTSLDPSGSTPGAINTIAQRDNDLSVKNISITPPFPVAGTTLTLTAKVANVGTKPAANYSVSFFEDVNGDSTGQANELIARTTSTTTLPPGDSSSFSAQALNISGGEHQYIVTVDYSADENLLNNKRILVVTVGLPPRSVVINEIMYGPSGGEPEWIEISNTSSAEVNLKNWKLSNRITSTKYTITTSDATLPPKGFAVVTRDSLAFQTFHPSIPGLLFVNGSLSIALFSNSGDAVVVFDSRNAPMDSLFYSPSWGGSGGKSLERIALLGSSTEQSNWGTSLDPSGSTPGAINTIAQRDNDIAVRSISVTPAFPVAGTNLSLTAKVANVGTKPAANYTVNFFDDSNGDSTGQANELITRTTSSTTLQPGDSSSFSAQALNISGGEHQYIVMVDYSADENLLNNKRILVVSVGLPPRSVVINEIMYGPSGGEPEWIEIYNTSSTEVNLKNWRVSNRTPATKYLISSTDVPLRPSSYAVITKDVSILNFHSSIPSTLVVVSGLPTALFSNSGDAVVLYDGRTAVMDSLTYTPAWGGGNGKSLERMDSESASTDSTNWGTSTDPEGSTPGRQNSIATLENDLKALRVFFPQPTFISQAGSPQQGNLLPILATVQNAGRQPASGYVIKLYHDMNRDSVLSATELLGSVVSTPTLQRHDSAIVQFTWQNPLPGLNRIAAVIEYTADQRSSNNTAFGEVSIGFQPRALIINEIMYGPLTNQAEWIELFNPGPSPVDLSKWTLSDMRDATGKSNVFSITKAPVQIAPGGYGVISSDSSILSMFPSLQSPSSSVSVVILNRSSFSLNNEGDDVIITDLVGIVIDSARYSPSWHNPEVSDVTGVSLERINPNLSSNDKRNWSSCVEKVGGTPGHQNSIFTTTLPSQTTLSVSPNPFSPDGDGFEDFTIISYQLPSQSSQIRVRVFDSLGRPVRTLANNELSASRGQIIWDGLDDEKRRTRMGIYVIFLEAIDTSGGVVETAKAVAVVAGRL